MQTYRCTLCLANKPLPSSTRLIDADSSFDARRDYLTQARVQFPTADLTDVIAVREWAPS